MENENCGKPLISLDACGSCDECLKNIYRMKEILRFYDIVSKPENTNVYAKIFHTDKGQILVKIDQGESHNNDQTGDEVRFYLKPEGMGVCSTAINFNDTDGGYKAARLFFESVTEEKALVAIEDITNFSDSLLPEK